MLPQSSSSTDRLVLRASLRHCRSFVRFHAVGPEPRRKTATPPAVLPIAFAPILLRIGWGTRIHECIRHCDLADGDVGEKCASVEKRREILGAVVVELADGADDVSDDCI